MIAGDRHYFVLLKQFELLAALSSWSLSMGACRQICDGQIVMPLGLADQALNHCFFGGRGTVFVGRNPSASCWYNSGLKRELTALATKVTAIKLITIS